MAARILDGKALAAQVRAAVKQEVAALSQRGIRPGLAVVLAGDNPASRVYVRNKVRACEETGVRSELYELPAAVSEEARSVPRPSSMSLMTTAAPSRAKVSTQASPIPEAPPVTSAIFPST